MSIHDEARLDQKFVAFAKLMNIYLNHFPRHEKYGLAQQIRNAAYDVYGQSRTHARFHPEPQS